MAGTRKNWAIKISGVSVSVSIAQFRSFALTSGELTRSHVSCSISKRFAIFSKCLLAIFIRHQWTMLGLFSHWTRPSPYRHWRPYDWLHVRARRIRQFILLGGGQFLQQVCIFSAYSPFRSSAFFRFFTFPCLFLQLPIFSPIRLFLEKGDQVGILAWN